MDNLDLGRAAIKAMREPSETTPHAVQITIEDTGKGVRFEGDTFEPGYRVWRTETLGGGTAYVLTRSVFFDDADPPAPVEPISKYELVSDIEAFNRLMAT